MKILEDHIFQASKIVFTDQLKSMKRVLRRLAFIDKEDIVLTKGKVACIVSTCDEVLLTEFMFKGLFNKMSPAKIAAFLSAVVFDESLKQKKVISIKDQQLQTYFDEALKITKDVYDVYIDSKIEGIEQDAYLECLNPKLMMSTLQWCLGKTFSEILQLSDNTYEGSIIRCFRRLDVLLK